MVVESIAVLVILSLACLFIGVVIGRHWPPTSAMNYEPPAAAPKEAKRPRSQGYPKQSGKLRPKVNDDSRGWEIENKN